MAIPRKKPYEHDDTVPPIGALVKKTKTPARSDSGVEYNYHSPRWSGEILDCSMPMTFDQYDHCSFNCLYCFSYNQKSLKEKNPLFKNETKGYQANKVRAVNPEHIRSLFNLEKETQYNDYIRDRITMQWGGLSDPFDMFEKKHRVGLDIFKILKGHEYPLCLSTKGTWWLDDPEYVALFENEKAWNTKFSIINYDKTILHFKKRIFTDR